MILIVYFDGEWVGWNVNGVYWLVCWMGIKMYGYSGW